VAVADPAAVVAAADAGPAVAVVAAAIAASPAGSSEICLFCEGAGVAVARLPFSQSACLDSPGPVLQKRPQPMAPTRMAELPERLRLDLSDSLSRYREVLSHFLQRVFASVF
jgi:hypothetical protein